MAITHPVTLGEIECLLIIVSKIWVGVWLVPLMLGEVFCRFQNSQYTNKLSFFLSFFLLGEERWVPVGTALSDTFEKGQVDYPKTPTLSVNVGMGVDNMWKPESQ